MWVILVCGPSTEDESASSESALKAFDCANHEKEMGKN